MSTAVLKKPTDEEDPLAVGFKEFREHISPAQVLTFSIPSETLTNTDTFTHDMGSIPAEFNSSATYMDPQRSETVATSVSIESSTPKVQSTPVNISTPLAQSNMASAASSPDLSPAGASSTSSAPALSSTVASPTSSVPNFSSPSLNESRPSTANVQAPPVASAPAALQSGTSNTAPSQVRTSEPKAQVKATPYQGSPAPAVKTSEAPEAKVSPASNLPQTQLEKSSAPQAQPVTEIQPTPSPALQQAVAGSPLVLKTAEAVVASSPLKTSADLSFSVQNLDSPETQKPSHTPEPRMEVSFKTDLGVNRQAESDGLELPERPLIVQKERVAYVPIDEVFRPLSDRGTETYLKPDINPTFIFPPRDDKPAPDYTPIEWDKFGGTGIEICTDCTNGGDCKKCPKVVDPKQLKVISDANSFFNG